MGSDTQKNVFVAVSKNHEQIISSSYPDRRESEETLVVTARINQAAHSCNCCYPSQNMPSGGRDCINRSNSCVIDVSVSPSSKFRSFKSEYIQSPTTKLIIEEPSFDNVFYDDGTSCHPTPRSQNAHSLTTPIVLKDQVRNVQYSTDSPQNNCHHSVRSASPVDKPLSTALPDLALEYLHHPRVDDSSLNKQSVGYSDFNGKIKSTVNSTNGNFNLKKDIDQQNQQMTVSQSFTNHDVFKKNHSVESVLTQKDSTRETNNIWRNNFNLNEKENNQMSLREQFSSPRIVSSQPLNITSSTAAVIMEDFSHGSGSGFPSAHLTSQRTQNSSKGFSLNLENVEGLRASTDNSNMNSTSSTQMFQKSIPHNTTINNSVRNNTNQTSKEISEPTTERNRDSFQFDPAFSSSPISIKRQIESKDTLSNFQSNFVIEPQKSVEEINYESNSMMNNDANAFFKINESSPKRKIRHFQTMEPPEQAMADRITSMDKVKSFKAASVTYASPHPPLPRSKSQAVPVNSTDNRNAHSSRNTVHLTRDVVSNVASLLSGSAGGAKKSDPSAISGILTRSREAANVSFPVDATAYNEAFQSSHLASTPSSKAAFGRAVRNSPSQATINKQFHDSEISKRGASLEESEKQLNLRRLDDAKDISISSSPNTQNPNNFLTAKREFVRSSSRSVAYCEPHKDNYRSPSPSSKRDTLRTQPHPPPPTHKKSVPPDAAQSPKARRRRSPVKDHIVNCAPERTYTPPSLTCLMSAMAAAHDAVLVDEGRLAADLHPKIMLGRKRELLDRNYPFASLNALHSNGEPRHFDDESSRTICQAKRSRNSPRSLELISFSQNPVNSFSALGNRPVTPPPTKPILSHRSVTPPWNSSPLIPAPNNNINNISAFTDRQRPASSVSAITRNPKYSHVKPRVYDSILLNPNLLQSKAPYTSANVSTTAATLGLNLDTSSTLIAANAENLNAVNTNVESPSNTTYHHGEIPKFLNKTPLNSSSPQNNSSSRIFSLSPPISARYGFGSSAPTGRTPPNNTLQSGRMHSSVRIKDLQLSKISGLTTVEVLEGRINSARDIKKLGAKVMSNGALRKVDSSNLLVDVASSELLQRRGNLSTNPLSFIEAIGSPPKKIFEHTNTKARDDNTNDDDLLLLLDEGNTTVGRFSHPDNKFIDSAHNNVINNYSQLSFAKQEAYSSVEAIAIDSKTRSISPSTSILDKSDSDRVKDYYYYCFSSSCSNRMMCNNNSQDLSTNLNSQSQQVNSHQKNQSSVNLGYSPLTDDISEIKNHDNTSSHLGIEKNENKIRNPHDLFVAVSDSTVPQQSWNSSLNSSNNVPENNSFEIENFLSDLTLESPVNHSVLNGTILMPIAVAPPASPPKKTTSFKYSATIPNQTDHPSSTTTTTPFKTLHSQPQFNSARLAPAVMPISAPVVSHYPYQFTNQFCFPQIPDDKNNLNACTCPVSYIHASPGVHNGQPVVLYATYLAPHPSSLRTDQVPHLPQFVSYPSTSPYPLTTQIPSERHQILTTIVEDTPFERQNTPQLFSADSPTSIMAPDIRSGASAVSCYSDVSECAPVRASKQHLTTKRASQTVMNIMKQSAMRNFEEMELTKKEILKSSIFPPEHPHTNEARKPQVCSYHEDNNKTEQLLPLRGGTVLSTHGENDSFCCSDPKLQKTDPHIKKEIAHCAQQLEIMELQRLQKEHAEKIKHPNYITSLATLSGREAFEPKMA